MAAIKRRLRLIQPIKRSLMQRRSSNSVKVRSVPKAEVTEALRQWGQGVMAEYPEDFRSDSLDRMRAVTSPLPVMRMLSLWLARLMARSGPVLSDIHRLLVRSAWKCSSTLKRRSKSVDPGSIHGFAICLMKWSGWLFGGDLAPYRFAAATCRLTQPRLACVVVAAKSAR